MKRFYNLLSLFLLSIAGITSAMAQGYGRGSLLSSMDEVVTQQVYVYSAHVGDDGEQGYLNAGNDMISTPTDDCLYQFEEVAGRTVTEDGNTYKVYRMKQVSTGLYLKDYNLDDVDDDDTSSYPELMQMTANADEAYLFTALPYTAITVEESQAPGFVRTRTTATPAKQILTEPGFVFARVEVPAVGHQYLGHLHRPFWSPYVDTNVWQIYSLVENTGLAKIRSYMQAIYGGNRPSDTYTAGTAPGTYDAALVQAAQAVYDEANAQMSSLTYDDEQIDDLIARMQSTMEALLASYHPIVAGYYFINTRYDGTNGGRQIYANTVDGTEFVWSTGQNAYTIPETLTPDDVKYVWKVTPTEQTDSFLVQYVLTGNYMNGRQASANTDDGMGFILGEEGPVLIQKGGVNGTFNISTLLSTTSGHKQFHAKFDNRAVMAWNASESGNNCYVFTPVSEEDVLAQLEQAKQDLINNELSAVIDAAKADYNKGLVYDTPASQGAGISDVEGALVEPAGDEVNSNWFTNHKELREGAYENLFDGDYTTYFHTDWSAGFEPSRDNYHFLAARLLEPVSNGVQIKMAKRVNGNNLIDYPTRVVIFGSNDVELPDSLSGTWTELGETDVEWTVNATVNNTVRNNMIGFANVLFDGSYEFIKMAVIATDQNRGYFALSEANMWQINGTEKIETPEMAEVPTAIKEALANQITEAEAALASNAATNDDIAALQAAYDEFMNNYPDPSRVSNLVREAESFLQTARDSSLIGDKLAMYSETEAEALETVIAEGKAFNSVDLASINAMVEKLNNALDAFKSSVILPTPGKYYFFRSASEKMANAADGTGLNSYNALVYSPNNSTVATNRILRLTLAEGTSDFTAGGDLSTLTDSVVIDDDLRYLWLIESAEAGKLVMRNVGTGMYMATSGDGVYQSTTPFELSMEGIKQGIFMINAGQNESGTTTYVNAQRAGTCVTVWSDHSDLNSRWMFQEVTNLRNAKAVGVDITAGQYTILTLPYEVDVYGAGTAYNLVGLTADNKLVITEATDVLPAATPFIYRTDELERGVGEIFLLTDLEETPLSNDGAVKYEFEPVSVPGLAGTICESVTLGTGLGYFNNNEVSVTTMEGAQVTIAPNRGYFTPDYETGVEAGADDITFDLGNAVIDAIDETDVVVVPSVVNVYSVNGMLLRKDVKAATATQGLPAGLYIVGGAKVIVK